MISSLRANEVPLDVYPMLAEAAWYCVRSQRRREHIAATYLRKLDGVAVFCPRIRFKKAHPRGAVWVTDAMFPGYLFARFPLSDMHRQIRYAHGVSCIVKFGNRYPIIEDEIVARLQDRTGLTEVAELSYGLSQGAQVMITDGALVGLEAVVTQVLPAKQRVRILMEFLGRKLEAEVEHASVLSQGALTAGLGIFEPV
jgi:transcriptional antiterminator RfaH